MTKIGFDKNAHFKKKHGNKYKYGNDDSDNDSNNNNNDDDDQTPPSEQIRASDGALITNFEVGQEDENSLALAGGLKGIRALRK